MKLLILIACVAAAYAVVISSKKYLQNAKDISTVEIYELLDSIFPDHWLEVPLDHFNLFDNRTWQMRYKVTRKFYKEGGPLFIEVGGEWTIHGVYFIAGQLKTLAEKHGGMLIETEHRYYGKSLPFGNNFSTPNLEYLQIEQALEDLAFFIEHFKTTTPGTENSKVIIHGCSYPGMLVTWMRLRFPHIVDIAYASSAPLGVGLDYPEFFEVVNDVYANVSSQCIDTIREGFKQTEELMETKEGRTRVRDTLRKWKCGDVDEMGAFEILSKYISVLNVMHDPVNYEDISCLALAMDTDDTEPFERLANMIMLKSIDREICSDEENTSAETEEEELQSKGWSYQTCTEMGTFTTLNRTNPHHPFGTDLSVHDSVESCVKEFGEMVTEDVLVKGTERVTRRYGGKKPKVTKVVTVQGTHDPWVHLAVLEDYTPEAPVLVFEGSHCIDVSERSDDPQSLVDLRTKIRDQISSWIQEIS